MGEGQEDSKDDKYNSIDLPLLRSLNSYILECCLIDFDKESALVDTHEHIRLLMDLWPDLPGDENKEQTLHDLLLSSGETFLQHQICESIDKNLDLAIKLLVEAIRVGQVAFSTDKNESMLSAICCLGEAYYKKNMKHDSIAAFQWALSIGGVLQSESQKSGTGSMINQEVLSRQMIMICQGLAQLHMENEQTKSLEFLKSAFRTYDFGNMETDLFDDMIDTVQLIGTIALKEEGSVDRESLEFLELGVLLKENDIGNDHPDLIPLLSLLEGLYNKIQEEEKKDAISKRIVELRCYTCPRELTDEDDF